jgi:hypothetical protein
MKKIVTIFAIVLSLMLVLSTFAFASSQTTATTTGKLIEIKDKEIKTMEEYKEVYGSDGYGTTAYILNRVRILSIPLFFIIIVIAAIYQYVIGVRRADNQDRGFALMITSVTLLVICQVLPLIFTIVVRGWRG